MDKPPTLKQQDLVTHKYNWNIDEYYGIAAIGLCKIWANVEDFVPTFLKYLLEYRRIPTNALIIFKGWETPPYA